MPVKGETGRPPREVEAVDALKSKVEEFQRRLTHEAETVYFETGRGGGVTKDDVETAFNRLTRLDPTARRAAQKNITQAFEENRIALILHYGMSITMFICGLAFFAYSVLGPTDATGRTAGVAAGVSLNLMLALPIRMVIKVRQHNVFIRLLGDILDREDDPERLAALFQRLLDILMPERRLVGTRGAA